MASVEGMGSWNVWILEPSTSSLPVELRNPTIRFSIKILHLGIPGWCSGLAPAFGPGCDPGDPGSNPTSGSRCMEPASPSAYVSASLSISVTIINK